MLLELKGVKKYFPAKKDFFNRTLSHVKAVDGVSLAIDKGQNLGLVGESGSGKTTLGRVILRLYDADEGKIVFRGDDITSYSTKGMRSVRKSIQMVFQDPYSSLDPRFTVENILKEAYYLIDDKSNRQEQVKMMQQVLSSVNMPSDSIYRFPHEFSGGERQRIAIARALIMNPQLLVLDEAVSSLDVLVQEQIIRLLKELQVQYDLTYLFISHNLRVIKKLCQKIAVMYKGKIVEVANRDDIFKDPIHPYTKQLLSAAMKYKTSSHETEFEIQDNGKLVDRGNSHYVLE
jgi:oligopeptide transport system ATP-binding protein